MSAYFNDPNSTIIFVVGVLVSTLFIVGVWELMREGLTGIPGRITTKIKKSKTKEEE